MSRAKRADAVLIHKALLLDGWKRVIENGKPAEYAGYAVYKKAKRVGRMYLNPKGEMRIGTKITGANPIDTNRWMNACCKRHGLPGIGD